jgi:tetratricopeptide (TPR) repeat protein
MNQIAMGPLDEAILNLQEAIKLLKSIPDYYALAETSTDLARCYINNGDLETAYSILKETEKMIVQKGLQGFVVSLFYNTLAETYLGLFERSIEISKKITRGKLKKYILKTTRYAKNFKCGLPKTYRLNGSFSWIKGNHKKAHTFWEKSLDISQEIGCRHEEGLLYSDMGNRLQDIKYLKKAREIFVETGANLDLINAKKNIEKLESP